MPQRKSPPKDKHLEKVLALAKKHPDAAQLETFILQYYDDIAEEDILAQPPEDLYGAAVSHFEFGAKRVAGETKVRVFNPSPKKDSWKSAHTIIEVVNDDMPFLVDTTTMTLNRLGVGIHLTVHPIYQVKRDARGALTGIAVGPKQDGMITESWMHIEVDNQAGAETLAKLEVALQGAMRDVRATISDWQAMRDKLKQVRSTVQAYRDILGAAEVEEGIKFLEWLGDNHFTFLGVREYSLGEENGEEVLKLVPDSGLGILRESNAKVSQAFLVLPKDVRKRARAKEFMIVTKANSQATVHRPGYLDYVGVKRFDANGEVAGEWRFLGLFTTSAYAASPRDIPVLREKVAAVMRRSELPLASHDGKALAHILETLPRDELFQSTTDELFETAMGVVQLQERQRVKLFVRRDSFGRFFSCLVYVPRDRYTTAVRQKIETVLYQALNGKSVEHAVALSESALARLHVIVRTTPWQLPKFDRAALEKEIVLAVRSWQDELKDALVEKCGEEQGLKLFARYGNNFPAAYRDDIRPNAAVFDVQQVDALSASEGLRMSLYRPLAAPPGYLRFKTFRREQTIPISDALPMLEHMGVRVISERPYELDLADGSIVWIQDFELIHAGDLDVEALKEAFQDQFAHVWRGEAESDGFNRLVLGAGLDWRQTMLLRAYCKYLLQTGISFSQAYMERALYTHPSIAASLVKLFEARNDPAAGKRDAATEKLRGEIAEALEQVSSLDDDRILRLFLTAIMATLRTNFYQKDAGGGHKPYVSFKFDPSQLELPLPKPLFEIWVYSPRVEGVHLRMGKVARGGLRWSDRREDFRTEILGLVKAQNVKNTVIVPVGAKGGFYVKRPPSASDRDAFMKEGIACYQTFLRGLLDITDNLAGTKVIPPKDVVRHDPDDPYLVVAADKGTATFSDIANGVSAEYGFWLGDAFASGGSAGYDHKKMAITAKGGWESVKRHFREMGTDIQTTDFTVVGVGDMSGDVFGNGMLLSRHIKLVAAFDHRHVFLDPKPDPEKSFRERERLFNLPRSSWADYDAKLISTGGGVWPRSAKSVPVSPEAAAVLGMEPGNYAPLELLKAILKAPVDLLWNGGIGTYVKASSESHAEVGDRANDAIRLDGRELRCKVVGEGGNLGCTQRGRVEYALNGGRINTDFIDNSAGVDCSDHEVNIKILLNLVASEKTLTEAARNKLLAEMTDEVAELVLRDNYMQAQAISVAEMQAPGRLSEHAYLIRALEKTGVLNRVIEFLPSEEGLLERRKAGRGLTRPELAVILAYSKIDIYNNLLAGDVAEDPYLANELETYFPTALQKRYAELMPKHRLRREIICTAVTNGIVNRMGSTFVHRMSEETGVSASTVARAYTIAQESLSTRALWQAMQALDNQVPASVQISMAVQSSRLLKHVTRWFIDHQRDKLDIAATVPLYQSGISSLVQHFPAVLSDDLAETYNQGVQQYVDVGVPDALAKRIAAIGPLYAGMDMVDVARQCKLPVEAVAKVYFHVGRELEIDWLRSKIEDLPVDGHWQAVARGTLREDLYAQQRELTAQALGQAHDVRAAVKHLDQWLETHASRLEHARHVLADMKAANIADFPSLSVALQEIRRLARLS